MQRPELKRQKRKWILPNSLRGFKLGERSKRRNRQILSPCCPKRANGRKQLNRSHVCKSIFSIFLFCVQFVLILQQPSFLFLVTHTVFTSYSPPPPYLLSFPLLLRRSSLSSLLSPLHATPPSQRPHIALTCCDALCRAVTRRDATRRDVTNSRRLLRCSGTWEPIFGITFSSSQGEKRFFKLYIVSSCFIFVYVKRKDGLFFSLFWSYFCLQPTKFW